MGKIFKLSAVLLVAFMFATFVFIGCSDDGNGGEDDGVRRDGDVRTISVAGIDIEVVYVSAGTFTMGDSLSGIIDWEGASGSVMRQVTLTRGFWIGKYPITQTQYQAVMGTDPSFFRGRPDNPVERVSWYNAAAFADSVDGRLPTDAEWEFAARGGNKSQGFVFSGSNDSNEVGWFGSWDFEAENRTHEVGKKKPNELGIYDMSGNVWEWVSDWKEDFDSTPVIDPTGAADGSLRASRGGSYMHNPVGVSNVLAQRRFFAPALMDGSIGFRVVFDAD